MKRGFLPVKSWFGAGLILALLGGCFKEEETPDGPIELDKLWTAWQSDGWNPIFQEHPGASAAEIYRLIKVPFENPDSGSPYAIYPWCDVYVCAAAGDDTCFLAKSYSLITRGNSLDFSTFMNPDERPILRLTDASLIYKMGSLPVKMVPCRKVLARRSGDTVRVDWPAPNP